MSEVKRGCKTKSCWGTAYGDTRLCTHCLEAEVERLAGIESAAVAFEIKTQSELQSAHQERDRLRELLGKAYTRLQYLEMDCTILEEEILAALEGK